jgi:M6 family metalloprotease-like protein
LLRWLELKFALLVAFLILCAPVAQAGKKARVPRLLDAQKQDTPRSVASPPGASLNSYQRQRLIDYISGYAVALDTLRVIGLQVQFADSVMGGQPGSERDAVRDSTWFANEMRHLEQYYRGASRSRTVIAWQVEGTLYNLPEGMAYYGDDDVEDTRVVELAQTLVDSADADVDFSKYDTIFIIHAGAGQETDIAGDSPEQIWSSFYDLADIQAAADSLENGLVTADSLDGEPYFANNFCVVPESASQDFQTIGSLGIWAFETGSRLGLLPMFDSTPSGFQDSQGVGNFCVMGYGLWIGPQGLDGFVPGFPCAFNRLISGWIDPVLVDPSEMAGETSLTLTDLNSGLDPDTVCVKVPITESEYYLVVNRVHDTNFDSLFTFGDADSNMLPENTDSFEGAEFDFYLTSLTNPTTFRYDDAYGFTIQLQYTGSGVYVWHVDENVVEQNVEAGYLPNDFVDRKGVDLEEADGVQDLDTGGFVGFIYGSHFDSFRSGDGNANSFGPTTKPNSTSNGGAVTGITIDNISAVGTKMTLDLSRAIPYSESRTRWVASGESQPATVGDIDGDGDLEIVVLADTGMVYVFNPDGTEYDDADADPSTIDPYLTAPGALWAGPPALGNVDDAAAGDEIVAAATDGRLYAWTGPGDLVTGGVLYQGNPLATSPLLVDINDSGIDRIVIVESANDTLTVGFVAPNGNWFVPTDGTFGPLWPLKARGQLAAPLALARTEIGMEGEQTGVVLVSADTLSATTSVVFAPAFWSGGVAFVGPAAQGWSASWSTSGDVPAAVQLPSPPASGDLDGDGYDEVVLTVPDGRLMVFDDGVGDNAPNVTQLRAVNPSGPALGDADLDGTLEIACWDDEYMYLKKWNGSDVTNWPVAIVPPTAGPQPYLVGDRGLEGPAVGDFDGDGAIEAVYPLQDGTIHGLEYGGTPMTGFPRAGPAGAKATPTVAALAGSGETSLVTVGFWEQIDSYDTVLDTAKTTPSMTLSIQSLPGSDANDTMFWTAFQAGSARQGVVTQGTELKTATDPVESESFIVYPNPVPGAMVHARITLNAAASVVVQIYNFEGERAVERQFTANTSGVIGTPFDQQIDVSALKSGVYFMRMEIESASGTEKLVKPFAIRR